MEQKKNYTLPIVMMFLLFAMISFVTGLSNPLGVIVKNQFAVANWMSQLGNFANFIAYAVMGIPAGMMLKRIGYKKTALAAVAVGFVGVGIQYLSGVAGSFPVYLIGAFVSGFSMCMLNTVVNPMLNTLGGGGKKGNQLIQFGGSLNSISATIVPILVGYLMGNCGQCDDQRRGSRAVDRHGHLRRGVLRAGGGPAFPNPSRSRTPRARRRTSTAPCRSVTSCWVRWPSLSM